MNTDLQHKKKIMHITHGLGGIQTYLEQILVHSDKATFEYIIVAPQNVPFQGFCAGLATYYPLKVKREINPFGDFFLLMKLISIIRKEKPDVLHVHSAKGGFLGRLAGKFFQTNVLYTPHGFSFLSFTGAKRMFYFWLEYVSRNWSNLLVAVSQSEANRAIFELGYRPEKIKVIPNAVKKNDTTGTRDFSVNYRIGMIGRLTIQKNPMLFMEIAKTLLGKYPQLQFSILGAGLDDHLGKALQEFSRSNNLQHKIKLLPWGRRNTGNEFLAATDIFVLTSVFEGLPYSLLEAMESECACVVSKADGNNDVIQNNENGFSCLGKDEFCERIELLINDRALREKMGKAAQKYVREKHDLMSAIRQLEAVYIANGYIK